jgi:DNA-binding NarL/FixJ family response regulator
VTHRDETAPITVFIVEDDDMTRSILVEELGEAPGFAVAGEAASIASALERFAGAPAQLALVDLGLGSESGVDLIRELKARYPATEIMAHTVFDDREIVFHALRAGAAGYVLKGVPPAELCEALHELAAGGSPMTPRIARFVIHHLQERHAEADVLSPRERQILKLVDRGLTYKEIAQELSVSAHTVHTHIKNIYERLQADGRKEALARARRLGLV